MRAEDSSDGRPRSARAMSRPGRRRGIFRTRRRNDGDQSSPRFARVLQTVTIEVQIDLDTCAVLQVFVDHTAPLRACGLAQEDDPLPALAEEDETLALQLAQRSDRWPEPTSLVVGRPV